MKKYLPMDYTPRNQVTKGNIMTIRAVEDAIRATGKYGEGVFTSRKKHPVQGEDFASRKFCKYYEVYPHIEGKINWDMSIDNFFKWLGPNTVCIGVIFDYDYRTGEAAITIKGGHEAVKELANTIPEFSLELARANLGPRGRMKVNEPSTAYNQNTFPIK